jgi:hypothetical protein
VAVGSVGAWGRREFVGVGLGWFLRLVVSMLGVVDLVVGFGLGFGCVLRRLAGLGSVSESPVSMFGSGVESVAATATSSAESATPRPSHSPCVALSWLAIGCLDASRALLRVAISYAIPFTRPKLGRCFAFDAFRELQQKRLR